MATPDDTPIPHPLIDLQFGIDLWKKTLVQDNSKVPDYTFEERYIRNTPRPVYPERDELDRLHLMRVESLPIRVDWTISNAFLESVRANPDKVVYIWCDENGDEEFRHTYRTLYDKTRSIAAHLKNTYQFKKGERVLLVYEPCVEFFHAFWACILLGVIPAPVCPPDPFNLEGDHTAKLGSIYVDATPKAILTSSKYKDSVAAARLLYPDGYANPKNVVMDSSKYLWIPTDTLPHISDEEFEIVLPPCEFTHLTPEQRFTSGKTGYPMFNPNSEELFKSPVRETDVAFLQYTSGSTGLAKGVIVHHRTLGANVFNCALLTQGLGKSYTYQWANGISWLPTFHDMGLIGFHVTPIVIGGTMLYQSPIHFIQNPVAWLKMISRCNEVFTGAPPFALDLLCKRTTEAEFKDLHLESIGSLILGAEPIRASYMEAFAKKFKPVGFNSRRFVTCFGMAENILHVTGKWGVGYGVTKILVSSSSLRKNKLEVYKQDRLDYTGWVPKAPTVITQNAAPKIPSGSSSSEGDNGQDGYEDESQWLVSSGEIIPFKTKQILQWELTDPDRLHERFPHYARREHGSYVIIVDPNTMNELPDGSIGEVWILSSSKTAGYWNRAELSKEQFHAELKSACKQSTKELIEWCVTKLPRLYNGVDVKGNLDPAVKKQSIAKTLNELEPHSTLLLNSLNTTTMNPTTHALEFHHNTTPLDQIKTEWLRTGDMGVVYNEEIYITGRIKDMIILRGQNFYADDIEHSFSTDTNDLTKANTSKLDCKATAAAGPDTPARKIANTRAPALNLIRPGHAIAYSIELTPTTKHSGDPKNDPVLKAGVEGEHLCLLVELSSDVVSSIAKDGDKASTTSSRPGHNNNNNDENDVTLKLKNGNSNSNATQKSGNQAPLWQRVLMNYSNAIVGGMAHLNSGDLDVQQQALQQPQTCPEKTLLYGRQLLFSAVRMGMATGTLITSLMTGDKSSATAAVTASTSHSSHNNNNHNNNNNNNTTEKDNDKDNSTPEDDELKESKRFLPPDSETIRMRELYSQQQLNSIAAAIRRIVSTKFMLVVDKIVFISPRTIRKTSSGKKRRNDTVFGVENGYYDHRIIGFSYSKAMQTYTNLVQKEGLQGGNVITNQAKSKLSSNANMATIATTTTTTPNTNTNLPEAPISFPNPNEKTDLNNLSFGVQDLNNLSTGKSSQQQQQQQQHYAGTVGISLGNKNDTYTTLPQAPLSLISNSTTAMGKGTPDKVAFLTHTSAVEVFEQKNIHSTLSQQQKSSANTKVPFKPQKLLPNYNTYQQQFAHQDAIHAKVKASRELAKKTTFEGLKPHILSLICREINAIHTNVDDKDDTDGIASAEKFTFGDSGSSTLTVEYLTHVSTLPDDEQGQLLDEFGMDSITGFKLAKAFSDEFSLPQANLGPHLFLNDSSLDGVIRVLYNLIQSNAQKLTMDYEKTYNLTWSEDFKPSTTTPAPSSSSTSSSQSTLSSQIHTDFDQHDKTAAYVFRGTTNNNRIPYILGIGTATPHIASPQDLVIEAMLVPMKMDEKSNERFRKIGAHSGIATRYSVLDNLGQIFWGKEGVNQGNDEYIDVRQQVFKRESVKLSIQSAADAVRDWLGDKVYLNDAERDEERMKKYLQCERLHQEYEKLTKKTYTDEKRHVHALESPSKTKDPSPIEHELALQREKAEKLKSVKSFAEGDSHLVETTSGNKEEDQKILQLGAKITTELDRTITHIVAITCTGIIVPGLEFHIMKALGLPETTQRLPITFAGCFGAVSGLRTASAIANENPLHRVLVVCTELCTLHMQLSDKIDNLVGSALFADGSGAFIVGCAPTAQETPIYSIDSLSSYVIPNTVQQMAWEATKSGQVIGLAKEIASEIFGVIGDVVDDLLQYSPDPKHPQHRIAPGDCNLAIHPGGPLIINTIQGGFGLPPIDDSSKVDNSHPVAETWKILHEYGNMSSATLVYVLDRLRLQKDKVNKPTPTLAFGPGLSVECSLLHRLDSNPGDKKNKK